MFDVIDNPNGCYPIMAAGNAYGETSDFWQVSSFRMYVRNMIFCLFSSEVFAEESEY